MKIFENFADLKAAAEKSAKKTLIGTVTQKVEESIADKADELVYGSYLPTWYQRRYMLGTAFNETLTGSYSIRIYDIEPGSPFKEGVRTLPSGYLAQMINDTGAPNIFNNNDYPWMHPRRFYDEAIASLKGSGAFLSSVKKSFLANM